MSPAPALLAVLAVVVAAAVAVKLYRQRRGPDRFYWGYLHGDWGRAAARENYSGRGGPAARERFSPDAPGACEIRCGCASWGHARAAASEREALRMLAGAA
jgi:hypothetical protein